MKPEEKRIFLLFAALLVCGLCLAFLWRLREPSAKIEFTEARFGTNHNLVIAYRYTASSGTYLHETDFVGGEKTGECGGGGGSLLGWPHSGSSEMSFSLYLAEVAFSHPAMLVETGKTYRIRLHNAIGLYKFTNNSGVIYQGRVALERE